MPTKQPDRFTLTEVHLKLLRHAYVAWAGDEQWGSPGISTVHPYGNGDVVDDVLRIIGRTPNPDYDDWSRSEKDLAWALHRETETALQIVLVTGAFEPGVYAKRNTYAQRSWERVGDAS